MDIFTKNAARLDGLDQLRAFLANGGQAPMTQTLGIALVEIDAGRAVFEGDPDASVYNPIGTVHGGYAATLLDSACGCAVHSRLSPDQGYATLELKISYHRPVSETSGRVRAEGTVLSIGSRAAFAQAQLTDEQGRLCASATSTLLVFDRKPEAD